jgi:hypothetical protein
MMKVIGAFCDYVNALKNQTQYAACIHTNMALDHKTNRTTHATLASVHLQKFLASTRNSHNSQDIRTACTKNYPDSIHKPHSQQATYRHVTNSITRNAA